MPKLETNAVLEIWKKNIDVQIHFNEIEIKIRNLFISIVLAVTAASGWVIEKDFTLDLGALEISFAIFLIFAGIVSAYLFLLMDRYWYHQLLKGAVDKNIKLEEEYKEQIKAFSVTSGISSASPINGFGTTVWGKIFTFFHVTTLTDNNLHSLGKIDLFYKVPIRIFQLSIFSMLIFGGISYDGKSLASLIVSNIANCFS